MKRDEAEMLTMTWMRPEDVVPTAISQTQRADYRVTPLT